MGFFWICPCGHNNHYKGKKTKTANSDCSKCKKNQKIWAKRVIEVPTNPDGSRPKRSETPTIPKIEFNGMVGDLIIALSWAINTIKNKPEVKRKVKYSTYFQYHTRWSRYRDYFQSLEEDK